MKTANNIIAIDQPNAELGQRAGAIVFWTLSGEVGVDALAALLRSSGISEDMIPEAPSPTVAAQRAISGLVDKRRLVRPLGNGSWAVVNERVVDGVLLEHKQDLTISFDAAGRLHFDQPEHPSAAQVQTAFDRHLTVLITTDISGWLAHAVDKFKGVSLRASGGFYFIPRAYLEGWFKIAKALNESSGHCVLSIPALQADETVQAVLAALAAEAETEITKMEGELEEEKLQERALKTRVTRCQKLAEKLTEYEGLLGQGLTDIKTRLDKLRSNAAAAALAASSEDE